MKTDLKTDSKWLEGFKGRVLIAANVKAVTELHRKIAKKYKVSYQTVNRYLNGEREIPIQFLFQIQAITGKPFAWLLTGRSESEINVDEVKRQGVQEFLAVMVGHYSRNEPTQSVSPKARKRA
jgi:transcriptional regulator with XRE-family HTH domain